MQDGGVSPDASGGRSAVAGTVEISSQPEGQLQVRSFSSFREPLVSEGKKTEDRIVCGNNWGVMIDGAGGSLGGEKAADVLKSAGEAIVNGGKLNVRDREGNEIEINFNQGLSFAGKKRDEAEQSLNDIGVNLNRLVREVQNGAACIAMGQVYQDADGKLTFSYLTIGDSEIAILKKDGRVVLVPNNSVRQLADKRNDIELYLSEREAAVNLLEGQSTQRLQAEFNIGSLDLEEGDRVVFLSDGVAEDLQNIRGNVSSDGTITPQRGDDGLIIGLDILGKINTNTSIENLPQAIFTKLDEARGKTKTEGVEIKRKSNTYGREVIRKIVDVDGLHLVVGGKGETTDRGYDDSESVLCLEVGLKKENENSGRSETNNQTPQNGLSEASKTADRGVNNADQARMALEQLANPDFLVNLLHLGVSGRLKGVESEIAQSLKNADAQERDFLNKLLEQVRGVNNQLLEQWEKKGQEIQGRCQEWQNQDTDPKLKALGYDLEKHLILFNLQVGSPEEINTQIQNLEAKGEENLRPQEKERLRLLRDSQRRLQTIKEERDKIKIKTKDESGQEKEEEIPDQVVEFAKKVVLATGQSLSETEQQQIAGSPLEVVAERMGNFIGDLSLVSQEAREEKIDDFIQKMGITEEGQKNEIKREINEILQMYEGLKKEISESLQRKLAEEGENGQGGEKPPTKRGERVKNILKGVGIFLGLIAFIMLLESQKKG